MYLHYQNHPQNEDHGQEVHQLILGVIWRLQAKGKAIPILPLDSRHLKTHICHLHSCFEGQATHLDHSVDFALYSLPSLHDHRQTLQMGLCQPNDDP